MRHCSRYFIQFKKSPIPYNFKYQVKLDDNQHASFGDTRMSDERSHVSGSYHVLLPDGRHQHVNYKDEGSASNLVEYKQHQEIQKDYNQEQAIDYTRSSTHSIPLTKRNVDNIIRNLPLFAKGNLFILQKISSHHRILATF